MPRASGMKEFRKATQEVVEGLVEPFDGERSMKMPSHPVLMALTFILGAACVILVMYEFSK
jgi:hypothetical protein